MVELKLADTHEIVQKALADYEAWYQDWKKQDPHPADTKCPYDFLPEELQEYYFDFIMEGNSKEDLAMTVIRFSAYDPDIFASDITDMAEHLEEAERAGNG